MGIGNVVPLINIRLYSMLLVLNPQSVIIGNSVKSVCASEIRDCDRSVTHTIVDQHWYRFLRKQLGKMGMHGSVASVFVVAGMPT